jgi:PAS domain S-box-containing protein
MRQDERLSKENDIKSLWAAIADREARLLALVKATANIVWVTDKDGNVLADADPPQDIADLTWSSFTGISQENLRGRGWAAALHPDDLAVVAAVTKGSRDSGNPFYCEFRIRHHSGEWRWVTCRGSAVRGNVGEIVGWIGSCTDITAAKKTEEALRESQQRLLAALEAGEMSTWTWRLSDNTFWWDEDGEKLWGLAPDPTRSHDLIDLSLLIHPEDRAAVARARDETVATGVAHSVEFRTVRADGKLQWLSSRGRVEKDADGKPIRVIGVFVDVTKLKVAEESMRQVQKMQALGTLAGGIAHDFNNLLLTISGNTRFALSDLDKQHPSYRSLLEISKASARAADLVRRILTFSARQPLAPATTPLMPAIDEALTLLQSSLPNNVRIQTRFDDTGLACTLGLAELQQVIVNLVNNAVHAIGETEGAVEIIVRRGTADDSHSRDRPQNAANFACVVIRDSGCGMGETTRIRIFEPFFTTKPAGKGTGLGLAVVHGIVEGCGGNIVVESDPGRGATFTLWLPLAQATAAAEQPTEIARKTTVYGEHILYVDDDEAINFLIQRLLEQLGYRVTCCDDPLQAHRLFAEQPQTYDVVVTDLSMPGMNGFDLVRGLKSIRANVPVIMTSGYVRDEDQARATHLGIDHVILKPNTVDELGHVLDSLCTQLRAQSQTKR